MRFLICLTLLLFFCPRAADAQRVGRRALQEHMDELVRYNPVYSEGTTGFSVCDLNTGDQLYGYNAERYFVPASNVKLLTFYAAQRLLGGEVPALRYRTHGDTTDVWGTGYPLLLHPAFYGFDELSRWFAERSGLVVVHAPPAETPPRYGAGWSWDDYNYGYVYERSALPVYGNRLYVDMVFAPNGSAPPELYGAPPDIANALVQDLEQDRAISRVEGSNQFTVGSSFYYPDRFPVERPITVTPRGAAARLTAAFPNMVAEPGELPHPDPADLTTVNATLPDTLYRKLLQDSDNYLAEQLVILAASNRYGWADEERFFDFAVDTLFREIQLGDLRYADGSGLSRYNLVKPRQFAQLLGALDRQVGRDRLTLLLPAGGVNGTLERRFGNRPQTYVWAKTGTLSGVTCVSGLLHCRSGRWLSFSFMHNNIMGRTADYYREMERALGWIYDNL